MTTDDQLPLDSVALAVEEQFLREWQAGKRPRLSVYAARYPAYATRLAELVASLPPYASDAPDVAGEETVPETLLESFPERLWTGEGVNRALTDIFGEADQHPRAPQLGRVAEERQAYDTGRPSEADSEARPLDNATEPADK